MIGAYEVLVAARGRIRRGWTQGSNARRADGAMVDSTDARAMCWCANGALMRANHELRGSAYAGGFELGKILDEAVGGDYVGWNDAPGRTQAEVIEAFDRAIEIAKSRASDGYLNRVSGGDCDV